VTASGGARLANPFGGCETRGRAQSAPKCSSPPCGSIGGLLDDGKMADSGGCAALATAALGFEGGGSGACDTG
jgi:hypothetical protein